MNDKSVWPTVWEFACACMLVALAALALFGLTSCAAAPRVVVVPHICAPSEDSPAYQKCLADCPQGKAFVIENANDIACYCNKPHEM